MHIIPLCVASIVQSTVCVFDRADQLPLSGFQLHSATLAPAPGNLQRKHSMLHVQYVYMQCIQSLSCSLLCIVMDGIALINVAAGN
jgi:hypothetical protein